MKQAIWNDTVLAESEDIVEVEGNCYFPESSLNKSFFKASDTHTHCAWKGEASYFDVEVNGNTNPGAAWYYPQPLEAAKHILGRVAFWKGVQVVDASARKT